MNLIHLRGEDGNPLDTYLGDDGRYYVGRDVFDSEGNPKEGFNITLQSDEDLAIKKAESEAYELAESAKEYQRQRANTYPDVKEQLDYIYHNGIDAWKTDLIDPVKAKYPKP
jgi:hypothetical protein